MGTKIVWALLGTVGLAICAGCGSSGAAPAQAAADEPAAKAAGGAAAKDEADAKGEGAAKEGGEEAKPREVKLDDEQISHLGIVTTAVQATHYSPQSEGYGAVISHDAIAQAQADLQTALAASRASEKAFARTRELANGPGALGVDVLENAQRQQAADQSAVRLAQRKLTTLLGLEFPWHGAAADAETEKLAEGAHRLLRVTFPPGGASAGKLKALRVSSLDEPAGADWTAKTIWRAPQDPTLPGQTVFALVTSADLSEGAHIRAQSLADTGTAGVVVPETAIVITEGQYWCYVKKENGKEEASDDKKEDAKDDAKDDKKDDKKDDGKDDVVFQRVAVDGSHPTGSGYFVADGIEPGAEVVTTGAGSLLARELNSSTEAGD